MKMKESHADCSFEGENRLYKIGMFAGMNHVTIKTLRHYDEQELLHPAYIDEENGYRYYELSQMAELSQILALRDMGFGLEEVKAIRSGESNKAILQNKKQTILQEIARLTDQLAKVESYLQDENIDLSAPVILKSLPKVICATQECVIQSYDDLFERMPEMGMEMERLGCICADQEYCFTQYLDNMEQEEDIHVEICEAVTKKGQDSEQIRFKEFEEVKRAACIYHKGSYGEIYKSYHKLLSFIEDNGYQIGGYVREVYIDGVWNKDSEKEWLTEIQIPLITEG